MELLYLILVISLVFQAVIFFLLNIPTPSGVKGRVAKFLATNNKVQLFLLAHLGFCLLAILLFVDSYRIEAKYREEKEFLMHNKAIGTGTDDTLQYDFLSTELRKSELSYKSLLVQRNKYIAFMTVFVSIALNLYIILMRLLYQKKDNFALKKNLQQARTSGEQGEEKKIR